MSVLPFEIFVPFGFVTYYWGVASLLAFGIIHYIILYSILYNIIYLLFIILYIQYLVVIVISLPLQMWISTFLFKAVNMYYLHNDERNKVTNETLSVCIYVEI